MGRNQALMSRIGLHPNVIHIFNTLLAKQRGLIPLQYRRLPFRRRGDLYPRRLILQHQRQIEPAHCIRIPIRYLLFIIADIIFKVRDLRRPQILVKHLLIVEPRLCRYIMLDLLRRDGLMLEIFLNSP